MARFLKFWICSLTICFSTATAFASPIVEPILLPPIVEYTFHATTQNQNGPPNATFDVLLSTVQSGSFTSEDVFNLHLYNNIISFVSEPAPYDGTVFVDSMTYLPTSGFLNLVSTADPYHATFATFSLAGSASPGSDIAGVYYVSGFDYWNGHWTAEAIGAAAVPEPSTCMLALMALSTVCGCRLIRRRAKSQC
ncbi:MAG: PEP-CTERM sorting domain-containing protein [Planctomycetaceae bacterium]